MSADQRVQYLIVGAGVSGLSFAGRLRTDDYLILEANEEPGGYCRTVRQSGFVWDYSGHFFHFRHPEIERELVSKMGDQRILVVEKDSRIWWGDRWIDFPFQRNIHQLPKQEFVDCLYDLFFRDERPEASFQDMLYAKFGKSIAEKFLIPYNEKLYATELTSLDADAMGRFFPYANIEDVVRNFRQANNRSYNTTFTYPEGGAFQYVRALLSDVDEKKVLLEAELERIDLSVKVAHTSRGTIAFEHLVSSIPFPHLLAMTGVEHDPTDFSWNKVLVFNLGFDRKGPDGIHWAYFPQSDLRFYRVGFYDNIFGSNRMSLYVEVGLPRDATVDEATVQSERRRVLADLGRCGIVQDHALVAEHSVLLDPAYVHITGRSNAEVERCKRVLAKSGVHSMGRYGSWTYCSIEDNIVEARQLVEHLDGITGKK